MKRVFFSFLILLSTVAFAIAQAPTPHVDPNYNPCTDGAKYDAAANTCQASTGRWLAGGGWVFILLLIAVPVAIFVGPKIFRKLGGKSNKTSDSEGGIH